MVVAVVCPVHNGYQYLFLAKKWPTVVATLLAGVRAIK